MSAGSDVDLAGVLNATDARTLTDQIKTGVEAVWHLITQAYTERAWDALGYSSWDDYCTREFGTSRLRLPREERSEVVSSLRESGLSLRAIASATGDSYGTVRNAIGSGEQNCSPVAPEPDAGTAECIHCGDTLPLTQLYEGGQGYECDPCVSPDDGQPDVPEQELPPLPENYMNQGISNPAEPAPAPAPIIGLDGKTYNPKPVAPQAPKERRTSIIDTARNIGLDLAKLTTRIENLSADDRLTKNKTELAARLRHQLGLAIKVCQDLDQQLTQGA